MTIWSRSSEGRSSGSVDSVMTTSAETWSYVPGRNFGRGVRGGSLSQKGVSRGGLSILAVLTGFASPIVDVDCGTNPSHHVFNIGKVVGASANDVSIHQHGTSSNKSTAKQTSDRCDQHREVPHVHGAHSHAAVSPDSAVIDFGSPSLIASSLVLQLAERNTYPPMKPPRIST